MPKNETFKERLVAIPYEEKVFLDIEHIEQNNSIVSQSIGYISDEPKSKTRGIDCTQKYVKLDVTYDVIISPTGDGSYTVFYEAIGPDHYLHLDCESGAEGGIYVPAPASGTGGIPSSYPFPVNGETGTESGKNTDHSNSSSYGDSNSGYNSIGHGGESGSNHSSGGTHSGGNHAGGKKEETILLPDGGIEFMPILKDEVPLSRLLSSLFIGYNHLNENDTNKLNEAHEEMRKDCFYEFIDNYLHQKNIKLRHIFIDPYQLGLASINSLGDLTFAASEFIQAERLKHEWIHVFQMAHHNLTKFGDNKGMMEFELALIQNILKIIEFEGDFKRDLYYTDWACYDWKKTEYQSEYQVWLMELTQNGTTYPSTIDNDKFQYFSKIFGEVNSGYSTKNGYIYGLESYKPSAMQALFNQAKKQCNK